MKGALTDQKVATMVSNVTETMLGMSFALADKGRALPEPCRVAVLPLEGGPPIQIALSSNDSGCAAFGAAMFRVAVNQVDASMMDDTLGELLNMAAGQIKNALFPNLALGLPKLSKGTTEGVDLSTWQTVFLRAGEHQLVVAISPIESTEDG